MSCCSGKEAEAWLRTPVRKQPRALSPGLEEALSHLVASLITTVLGYEDASSVPGRVRTDESPPFPRVLAGGLMTAAKHALGQQRERLRRAWQRLCEPALRWRSLLNAKEKPLRSEGEDPLPKVTGTSLKKMDRFGAREMAQ